MLSRRNEICLRFLLTKPAVVPVSYVSKEYVLSPIPVDFLLLVITSLLQEDANVKGRYRHREKGVTCPGRTFLSGDLGSDFAFIGDWCWDEHVSDVAVLPWSASRELSKQNLHWRELFGSVGVRVHLQQVAATGWIADAKDALTWSLEVQPAGYCGFAIFSAVTKWRQSFSNHEYLGYSEAFGSLNRAKLNEYLVHMYSIYQDGIGVGRRYQALGDKAEFLCCIFQKEQAIANLAWVQSKGKAISCPFSSPQSLSDLHPAPCRPSAGQSWRWPGRGHSPALQVLPLHRDQAHGSPAANRMCWRLGFATDRPLDGKELSRAIVKQKGNRF